MKSAISRPYHSADVYSAALKAPGENRLKQPKTQHSVDKVVASIFWEAHGIKIR